MISQAFREKISSTYPIYHWPKGVGQVNGSLLDLSWQVSVFFSGNEIRSQGVIIEKQHYL